MTSMNENVNWMKLTHTLSNFNKPQTPFCTFTFTSKFLIVLLNVHTKHNNASLLFILCTLMLQIIPLLKITLVCMLYEDSNPKGVAQILRFLGRPNVQVKDSLKCQPRPHIQPHIRLTLYTRIYHIDMILTTFNYLPATLFEGFFYYPTLSST